RGLARLFQGRARPRDRGEFYRGRGPLLVRAGGFAHQAPHGCQRQDDHRLFGERILKCRDALLRFVRAYRETLDWMFSGPDAVKIYAEETNVPLELAAMTRDKFQTKEAMRNDRLSDLDAVMAQAVRLKFLDKPLSKEQLAELIQILSP